MAQLNRRKFIQKTSLGTTALTLMPHLIKSSPLYEDHASGIQVNGHLWVYASKYPPHWDSTPIIEQVFSDFKYAGISGIELMEVNLRHDNAVSKLNELIDRYGVLVSGTSYGGVNMWKADESASIIKDVELIVGRLEAVGGKTFGVSVGSSKHLKTKQELDVQAEVLKRCIEICNAHDVELNLHNHTYEVENNLYDLKNTIDRIPNIKLGPDINWLIRAGVSPVKFINTYGKQIVYLHLRDQFNNGKWSEYLGEGDTDFNTIAEALKAQNFNGQVAIELAFENNYKPKRSLRDDWKKSRDFVKQTFNW